MKNRIINHIASVFAIIIFFSCSSPEKKNTEETAESGTDTTKITLTKAPRSYDYLDASLKLQSVDVIKGDSINQATFNFNVENYELGVQTPYAGERGIANSGKGQHIHFIVNNGPYSAHYEPTFTKEMEEGSYVILAFLSRSYHESVKNESSYMVDVLNVGDVEPLDVDFEAPHMFYSRPKGTYSGADTEKLMIDFFLLNVSLSPEGNRVRATVNDEVFYINEWAPYYIEGLEKGEVTVKLELIDAAGNVIPGPFNSVERKVILE